MYKKTRNLTLCALFTSFATVTLYISSIFPTGQLGIVALASLFVTAAVIECGIGSGMSVFVISCLLGALITSIRGAVLLYIVFFGYYPIAKCLVERLKSAIVQWIIKLVLFNAALAVTYVFFNALVYAFIGDGWLSEVFLFFILGNVTFVLFDYGYSKLIWVYINKISKEIKRK